MKKISLAISVALALVMALAGCGGSNTQESAATDTEPTPTPTESITADNADIIIEGAEPVVALIKPLAQMYMAEHPDIKISVTQTNSNEGIATLAGGIADIALLSRPLKDAELEAFPNLEAELIGKDSVVVVVSQTNTVTNLTAAQGEGRLYGRDHKLARYRRRRRRDRSLSEKRRVRCEESF